ncbi:MAG TPA: S26 family signal peptidase [Methanocorpusculum sp.]|nr:S26 family signal peptidase [Methanocorpusculum sp.]
MAAKKSTGVKTGKKEAEEKKEGAKSFLKEILIVIGVVAVIGIVLFAVSGTWPALIAVESGSMEPNIMTYALVFVTEENRFGGWQTQEEAIAADSGQVFNGYGDVIVYKPNGTDGVTPIIHRAIKKITAEEALEMGFTGDAAHAGVITKGDNPVTNKEYDQNGVFKAYGRMQPVKEEWIVGKALFAIPLIGWVPLHIIPCILIVIGIIVVMEIVSRVRGRK